MRRILIFVVFISIFGCAQRLKTPVSKGISPEVRGKGYKLSLNKAAILESKFKLDSNDDLSNSLSSEVEYLNEYKVEFAIGRQFEFYSNLVNEVGLMFGFKIQIWGLPYSEKSVGHKFSFAFNTGGSADEFQQDELKLDLESSVTEFSIIHGYRFSDSLIIYESFTVSEYEFNGNISNPPITFTRNDFTYTSSNTQTFSLGTILNYSNFDALLELSCQRYRWNSSNYKSVTAISYGIGYNF